MLAGMLDTLDSIFGIRAEDITAGQTLIRVIGVYLLTIIFLRIGPKRILGRMSPLDVMVTVILGSVMSRAINGTARFSLTVEAGALIVFIHWLCSVISFHWDGAERLLKGTPVVLIKDGEIVQPALRHSKLTSEDLMEALRMEGHTSAADIREARLERNGKISAVGRS